MGTFIYSPEEGTPAHDMKPRVRKNTAKDRFDRLMTLQAAISRDMNRAMVGRDIRVLLEERADDGRWLARSEADAPDVDGLVYVAHRDGMRAGDFADVRVTGADTYDLFAEA
jgi:ribosomal protein S12 methylthiotransferase